MMENETLKQLVLAKGKEIATNSEPIQIRPNIAFQWYTDGSTFTIFRYTDDGQYVKTYCRVGTDTPSSHAEWWIAAKILDIPTEMSIDEFELPMAIRQHYNDMQEAHDAGFYNAESRTITKEESWQAFIGDYGKEEIKQPVQLFDSQLHELCVALGWQGGTYHQVLAEVKRLKAFADKKRTESHC